MMSVIIKKELKEKIIMSIPVPEKRIAEFEKKAFGMFIHWGLYSSLDRGEWTFNLHEDSKDKYPEIFKNFTAKILMR